MKYSDVDLYEGFQHNMRNTSWTELFPSWWSEDALTQSIGKEIEFIKSLIAFQALENNIKPPVLLWQTSLNYKEKKFNKNITQLPDNIEIQAPIYKTWGQIIITNNSDEDILDLKIMFNDNDGILIDTTIPASSDIVLDITNQEFYVNNKKIKPFSYGRGLEYFITTQNHTIYDKNTPIHNEILRINFSSMSHDVVDLNVDVILENVVFENEQHIEVTGLELLPITRIELYAKYDFPYNVQVNGWKKVYQKEYIENTNVIYDRITTHFFTKEFYAEVWFQGIDYPYVVGFPCYKDAELDSKYHVKSKLDELGELLGLPRRDYRTNITEEEYPFTFPIFYPFDIEQDYWYYQRLINEYCENNLAINDVDIYDTDGNSVVRLHSINPFVEDFVVYASSTYPEDRENINYSEYLPSYVFEQIGTGESYKQSAHYNIENLLKKDNNYCYTVLHNNRGNNVSYELNKSKQLGMFFDLSNLPQNVNITGFEILLDTESMDNSKNKYNDERTSLHINNTKTLIGNINQTGFFGLQRHTITYGDKHTTFGLDNIPKNSTHVNQEITIRPFSGNEGQYYEIPFIYKENDNIVDNIDDVMTFYYTSKDECVYSSTALYNIVNRNNKKYRYLRTLMPDLNVDISYIVLLSTTKDYHPFNVRININQFIVDDDDGTQKIRIEGPFNNDSIGEQITTDDWDTGDLRDLIQKNGIYFIYALTNNDDYVTSTVMLYNASLKVYYEPKKSNIQLQTSIDKKNIQSPNIGKLNITVTNTGEKPLQTIVDIVSSPNLKLDKNYINVDLNIGDSQTDSILIKPEYPISDGLYEILTMCEDEEHMDYIKIESAGLIKTEVLLNAHYGKYNQNITLQAKLKNMQNTNFSSDIYCMNFYVDNIHVGTAPIINNIATLTINPSMYDAFDAGMHTLTAKFDGSPKYATSRSKTDLFISKTQIDLELIANDTILYNSDYTIKVNGQYIDEEGNHAPLNEGTISVYIDDELQLTKEIINGTMQHTSIITTDKNTNSIPIKPGKHILTVEYNETSTFFAKNSISQDIIVIGGNTHVSIDNINVAPLSNATIKAKIIDDNGYSVSGGTVTFYIYDNDELLYMQPNVAVNNGFASFMYQIPDILDSANDNDIKTLNIKANYRHNTTTFNPSSGTGTITIERKEVVIQYSRIVNASKHEPIGLRLKIIDANTQQGLNDITYDNDNNPIYHSKVRINIPTRGITFEANVEENGNVVAIYNPITFSADEWIELTKNSFKIDNAAIDDPLYNDEPIPKIQHENTNLYRIYDGDMPQLDLVDFQIIDGDLYYFGQNDASEQIFIGDDGNLYARTAFDDLLSRQYQTGHYPLEIEFFSDNIYKQQQITDAQIYITDPNIDIDLHTYDLTYGQNKGIQCFVTQYTWDFDTTTTIVEEGQVYFFIDNTFITAANINNGIAMLNNINGISSGHHLLTAEYINNTQHTYTHADLYIHSNTPSISYTTDRIVQGKKTNISIDISVQSNVSITGNVYLRIDDDIVDSIYLSGVENGHTTLKFIVPEDLTKTLSIEYTGNNYIDAYTIDNIPLILSQVEINTYAKPQMIGVNEKCTITAEVQAKNFIDDISEGKISLYSADNILIASGPVKHNIAILSFDAPSTQDVYQYTMVYEDSQHYVDEEPYVYELSVINHVDTVFVGSIRDIDNYYFDDINEALHCVKENGNINVIDDTIITNNIDIYKNINIIGDNDVSIIKDNVNLLTTNTLNIYDTNFMDNLQQVSHLTLSGLNTNHYRIIDNDAYYINNANELIPIYLCNDGNFYSTQVIDYTTTFLNINNNVNVNVDNIHFQNHDTEDKFNINVYGTLSITHSILDDNIIVTNNQTLNINESLVYSNLRLISNEYNIDNNWWGTNNPSYNTNNHIIATISTSITPPVLGEDFNVIVKLIGKNGKEYNIPNPYFTLTADSGYLQTPKGKLVNNQIETLYVDGAQTGYIYAHIDKEIISLKVYEYDHKSEIIFDFIEDIPIDYQVPIKIYVQSCADVFYKFDNNNNIIESSNDINDGIVTLYIQYNGETNRIGQGTVKNGYTEIPIFFSEDIYELGQYTLYATYKNSQYYFDSEQKIQINLISTHNVCYVSPNGNNNYNGTFQFPVQTIQQAINMQPDIIYLKSGEYTDNQVYINQSVTIKGYDGTITFNNNTKPIFINNAILKLNNLNFINNNIVVDNQHEVYFTNCIIKDNNNIVNAINSQNTSFVKCALISNTQLASPHSKITNMSLCWYGVNNPMSLEYGDKIINNINDDETSDDNNITTEPLVINDYIVMDLECSRDVIYIGDIARLTASIQYYMHDGEKLKLNEQLPLRIAKFATTYGELTPIKDYTYNNQATTIIDTSKHVNMNNKIFIDIDKNTNFINTPISLSCSVYDLNENTLQGSIKFSITDIKNKEIYTANIPIQNNKAICNTNINLQKGHYTLTCYYSTNETTFSNSKMFEVIVPQISLNNINIDDKDHMYHLQFYAEAIDSFNNPIKNQKVKFTIDNNVVIDAITQNTIFNIQNGILLANLKYDMIPEGTHKLQITTQGLESNYETYTQEFTVHSNPKITNIQYSQDDIQRGQPTDITFTVQDDEGAYVTDGFINIFLNDKQIYINEYGHATFEPTSYKNFALTNGTFTLPHLKINTEGQYSLTVYYSGVEGYYSNATNINNQFNVGLHTVKIDSETLQQQLNTHLSDMLHLKFQIKDISDNIVSHGNVQFYINGILINNDAVPIIDDYITYDINISQLTAGNHTFGIFYQDDNFLNTNFQTTLHIQPIQSNILINNFITSPNHTVSLDYDIESEIGTPINIGTLSAYYNDTLLNTINVADITNNKIDVNIGFLPSSEKYNIHFVYQDDSHIYNTSEIDVIAEIEHATVNIQTEFDYYYPNEPFTYNVYITDKHNNDIDYGTISVYIDNTKEASNIPVIDGHASVPLTLSQVKQYQITIIYHDNDYYAETKKEHKINVYDIPIKNITIDTPLTSEPNTRLKTNIVFDTYHNRNVIDGIIDFYFDGILINQYMIAENTKQIYLDIPDVDYGEYDFRIEYHDSNVFASWSSKDKQYKFNITKHQVQSMSVQLQNTAKIANNVNIQTNIDDKAHGIIKYYICAIDDTTITNGVLPEIDNTILSTINEENYQFIGMDNINNGLSSFSYILPYELDSSLYIIKALYEGNNQYQEALAYCWLPIIKQSPNIEINEISAQYQDTITIDVDTKIYSPISILLFIDDINIGAITTDNNGQGQYIYSLNQTYTEGDYTLKAYYAGNAVINEVTATNTLHVEKYTPIIAPVDENKIINDNIIAHKGGTLILNNIVLGNNNILLNTGNVQYEIIDSNEEQINQITVTPNQHTTITIPQNAHHLIMKYLPANDKEYHQTTKTYTLDMQKNDIIIELLSNNYITRGEDFTVDLLIYSKTTTLPISNIISIGFDSNNINLDMSQYEPSKDAQYTQYNIQNINIPPLSTANADQLQYQLTASWNENNIFKGNNQSFTVKNINKTDIYVDKKGKDSNIGTQESPIPTLNQAIDLIKNYGTIHLLSDIENENVENHKTIYIEGNNCVCKNITITNYATLTIKDIKIINSNSPIINYGDIDIDNLTATSNNNVIYSNNKIKIQNSYFNNNTTSNDNKNGACVYIDNKNIYAYIQNTHFNHNIATLFGGAIYSNKSNDITINKCMFYNQNTAIEGSSIAINGHANITNNLFYNNNGTNEIYLINGSINAEVNVFDCHQIDNNKFMLAFKQALVLPGVINANMNYWGTNNFDDIHERYSASISIDSWLLANTTMTNNERIVIDKYKNQFEIETNSFNTIEYILTDIMSDIDD